MNLLRVWKDKPRIKTGALPCFYCGVDEQQLKLILGLIIGGLVMGSVCILIWSLFNGTFQNVEDAKNDVFEADRRE